MIVKTELHRGYISIKDAVDDEKLFMNERRTHLQSFKMLSRREADDKWLLISSQENKENGRVGVSEGGLCA